MDRPFVIGSAVELVAYLRTLPSPVFVGIDGFSAAGKSTVAAFLADRARASVVHVDDFYADLPKEERLRLGPEEGYDRYFDWRRLRSVLVELRSGREVRFERFNWSLGCGTVGGGFAAPAPLVVVEGVYSCRPELAEVIDVTVLVDTHDSVRCERRKARSDLAPWPPLWDAAERYYLGKVRLADDFDIILRVAA